MAVSIHFATGRSFPSNVLQAMQKARRKVEALQGLTRNLDTVRAALSEVASSLALRAEVIALSGANKKSARNSWQVYYETTAGSTYLVATLSESAIGKADVPLVCPMCGTPRTELVPRTGAHNVVSAAVWRSVLAEIFPTVFGFYSNHPNPVIREGTRDFLLSLERVASSTSRSAVWGAATQGDRRTCKRCEELHGQLTLLQRYRLTRQFTQMPLEPVHEKTSKGKKVKVGHLHAIPRQQALGVEFGGLLGGTSLERRMLEEITRQRIEDVIRGLAYEIHNYNKYKEHGPLGKLVPKMKYRCLEIFEDSDIYFGFLDLIRQKAFAKAARKSTNEGESTAFVQKVRKYEYIPLKK